MSGSEFLAFTYFWLCRVDYEVIWRPQNEYGMLKFRQEREVKTVVPYFKTAGKGWLKPQTSVLLILGLESLKYSYSEFPWI